jgi:SAM-dependent methyltransferase
MDLTTKEIPIKCIVCGSDPEPVTWNGMGLLRCPTCGLVWQPKFQTHAEYYASEAYGFDDGNMVARRRNTDDRVYELAAAMPLNNVCDVGAYDGTFVESLKNAGYKDVWGIEPSPSATAYGKARGLDIEVGTLEERATDIAARGTKAITLFHVIEHLEEPKKALMDIFNLLPPGGYVVLETPTTESPVLKAKQYKDKLIYAEHLFYFNEFNLTSLLVHTGFTIVSTTRRDFDMHYMPVGESLMRLGWPTHRIIRALVRPFKTILSELAIKRGRLNYMLVVAQKPTTL